MSADVLPALLFTATAAVCVFRPIRPKSASTLRRCRTAANRWLDLHVNTTPKETP